MITKIIAVKRYNKFDDLKKEDTDWDFSFRKTNVIYAPNGSGKTSISLMLKSLCDNSSIEAKTSFGSVDSSEIRLLGDDKKQFIYKNRKWNRNHKNVEIFNSFYLEDNVYAISIEDRKSELNIFEMSMPNEARQLRKELNEINRLLSRARTRVKNRKLKLKNEKKDINKDNVIVRLQTERDEFVKKLEQKKAERAHFLTASIDLYISNINRYLSSFSNDLKIIDHKIVFPSNSNAIRLVYGIKINNHEIHFTDRESTASPSLKYYLSEGDKNALALSFFLAKMDIVPQPEQYIVVIDDPFTSFDTHRKQTTITQLVRVANKVGQLFILTHDLHFANDFCNALYCDTPLKLQIARKGNSYIIQKYDFKNALLTGLAKDIKTLNDFLQKGDDMSLRDVVRCIRPCVEGIFRLKYFSLVDEGQWLGDFIKLIKDANKESPLYRLKEYISQIEELNDYSKIYHHSNPNYMDVMIDPIELSIQVKNTINLLYVL